MLDPDMQFGIKQDGLAAILCPTMISVHRRIGDQTIDLMYELFMFLTICYPDFLENNQIIPTIIVIF